MDDRIDRLTRAIAGHGLPSVPEPESTILDGEEWLRLFSRVRFERITGLAVESAAGWLALSDEQAAGLLDAHRNAMTWCLLVEQKLLTLADAFDAESIAFAVLKGASVAHTMYEDPSLRSFADVDLLVSTADYERACALLGRLGHDRQRPEPRPGFEVRFGKASVHKHSDDGIEVDLHRTLVLGPFGLWIDPEELLDRREPFLLAGRKLSRLDDTGMLLNVAMHASLGWRLPRLVPLRDVAQVWTEGNVEWDTLARWAREWRLSAVLKHAFSTVGETFDVPLQREAARLVQVRPTRSETKFLADYTGTRRNAGGTSLATIRAIPGVRTKGAYMWALAFPDRRFLEARAGIDGKASYAQRWSVPVRWARARLKWRRPATDMIGDGRIDDRERASDGRTIVMFSYSYPPCVCYPTTSSRTEGLAHGLAGRGWHPIVITRANGCSCLDGESVADGNQDRVARLPSVEVRRIPLQASQLIKLRDATDRVSARKHLRPLVIRLRRLFTVALLLTEQKNDWTRRALMEGKAILGDRHVDAVWTTSGPYRTIGIGRTLQRQFLVPWVADLRDSVARPSFSRTRQGAVRSFGRRRWLSALRRASAVTCVSPEEALIDATALKRSVDSLPSGFDPTAWRRLRKEAKPDTDRSPVFRILYAGVLVRGLHDPGPFFSGLRRFVEAEDPDRSVVFTCLGRSGPEFLEEAQRHGVRQLVRDGGTVTLIEAQLSMIQADLLLHLSGATRESGVPGGKLYEYLAAGPPILSVPGTDAFVMDMLRKTHAGDGASDPAEVQEVLSRRYREWREGRATARSLDDLDSLSWPTLAGQLAVLLDEQVSRVERSQRSSR